MNILGNHQVSALCEECVNDSQVSGFGKLSVSVGKSCHGGDICQCGGRELCVWHCGIGREKVEEMVDGNVNFEKFRV